MGLLVEMELVGVGFARAEVGFEGGEGKAVDGVDCVLAAEDSRALEVGEGYKHFSCKKIVKYHYGTNAENLTPARLEALVNGG